MWVTLLRRITLIGVNLVANSLQFFLSRKVYGIRGIPAVVIIDAISGVVVSQEHVRNDIMRGCQRGDKGVVDSCNHWLTLIPEESKMIVQSVQLSLQEEAKMLQERVSSKPNSYLVRQVPEVKPKDPSEAVKCYFTALVAQGKNPTTAAAEAIARFAAEQSDGKSFTSLEMSHSIKWYVYEKGRSS